MNYHEANQTLQKLFEVRDCQRLIQERLRHVYRDLIYTCSNGSEIYISYPGLKARFREAGKVVYDYRVDIVTSNFQASLSHVNVIVDIYNKCLNNFDHEVMKLLLIQVVKGERFHESQYPQLRKLALQILV